MTRTPPRNVDHGIWIDRRRFIRLGAAGAVAAARPGGLGDAPASALGPVVQPERALAPRPSPTFSTVVRRRSDQLRLTFDFWNLKLQTAPQQVVRTGSATPYIVVRFLPQHVMEEAYYEIAPNIDDDDIIEPPDVPLVPEGPLPVPVGSRVASGTRLAFSIPDAALPIPYTIDELLKWDAWVPSVAPTARGSAAIQPFFGNEIIPVLAPPKATQTAIEAPWWLIMSPHRRTGWAHAPLPVTHGGRTEVWHTRFGGKPAGGLVNEDDVARKTMRAIWTRDPKFADYLDDQAPEPFDGEDFNTHPIGMPFRTPLSQRDRYDLVVSTADFSNRESGQAYLPLPVEVEQFMLSSVGAWIDLRGSWKTGNGSTGSHTSLESWRHISTGGRDHYVRIVRSGFLCGLPFGSSLFKVTERLFRTVGSGTRGNPKRRIGYLVQRYYVVLRQRELVLGGPLHAAEGRGFPFTRVRAKTLITPTLNPPVDDVGLGATKAFVLRVGAANKPFLFEMEGFDRADRPVDLAVPGLFVDGTIATKVPEMATLRDWYNGVSSNGLDVTAPERVIAIRGQRVAPAEPTDPGGTDTDVEVHRMTLGLEPPKATTTTTQLINAGRPRYFPTMAEAEIRLTSAEVVLGKSITDPGPGVPKGPVMILDPAWVTNGFDDPLTRGAVFVRLKDPGNPENLNFGGEQRGDRAGGVITPNIPITALSRRTGTVGGDPDVFQGGSFDPTAFFGSLQANLLGDIPLGAVIVGSDSDAGSGKVISLRTRETPDAFVTEMGWKPAVKSFGPFVAVPDTTTLDLAATITTPKGDPSGATSLVVGELRNFSVKLLEGAEFLEVRFNRLRFQSVTGKKTDVDVEILSVEFLGPLKFINDLRDYLSFEAGGFSIDVQPTQVKAGFELPIPSISVGVFSLQNITFVAGVTIPFTGDPLRFRFGFNSIDNPFLVSVMIFGGGGSFELAIGADGVESFQASLEFGIVAALDIGVASGSVSVTAGIYLAIGEENAPVNPDGKAELTGFLKIKGEVDVLGIISIGLFMKASFTYVPAIEKAVVKAVIIVEIDIFPFSGEVEIEYEKRFGGTDPTFGDSLSVEQWTEYTQAFAPIGA